MTARLIRERGCAETFPDEAALCARLVELAQGDPLRLAKTEISCGGPTEPAVRIVALDGARERWIGCAVIQPDVGDWPPPAPPHWTAAARHRAEPALAAIADRMAQMDQRVAA